MLAELAELARSLGLEVRAVRPPRGEGDWTTTSGTCRVRGRTWVLMAETDPVEQRIEVLVRALRAEASEELDRRYLAPALRQRLEAAPREA